MKNTTFLAEIKSGAEMNKVYRIARELKIEIESKAIYGYKYDVYCADEYHAILYPAICLDLRTTEGKKQLEVLKENRAAMA